MDAFATWEGTLEVRQVGGARSIAGAFPYNSIRNAHHYGATLRGLWTLLLSPGFRVPPRTAVANAEELLTGEASARNAFQQKVIWPPRPCGRFALDRGTTMSVAFPDMVLRLKLVATPFVIHVPERTLPVTHQ